MAQLRIAIYYQKNLVLSQLLTAQISEAGSRDIGYSSRIDYRLTADLHDLGFLPPRTFHVLTNHNSDGTHRVIINGNSGAPLVLNLAEGQVRNAMNAVREALRNIHFEENQGDRYNLLSGDNAKKKREFINDLERLAPLGWNLCIQLLRSSRKRKEWREKLWEPASIQISRVGPSTFVFPWGLVYDIPLDSSSKHEICPLVKNWDELYPLVSTSTNCCPYDNEHKQGNILCPFGFWGLRHNIEQPPSMPEGRDLPLAIQVINRPPTLVVGLSLKLDDNAFTKRHVDVMKRQFTQFKVLDCDSLEKIIMTLSNDVEIVYFYCHGGREPLPGASEPIPYLSIGVGEQIRPTDIAFWQDIRWPAGHWEATSPLVFINGCHTAELTPELLVNFVDAFAEAYTSGVIGTEITLHQRVSAMAAEQFFSHFHENGKNVGEALLQMRLHFLSKGNLLGLAYTPYCSAGLHL